MAKRRVTKVHLVGGKRHEHIAKLIWSHPEDPDRHFESTREQMVNFLTVNPRQAYVYDAPTESRVTIGVVEADPPYVRTYRDGEWQDNLLHLPRY